MEIFDCWSKGKTDGLFESDWYSKERKIAYSIKSVMSRLSPDYFSFWNRIKRKAFACYSMSEQWRNPIVLEVIGKDSLAEQENGLYEGYCATFNLREHFHDTKAEEIEYSISKETIETILWKEDE